MQVFSEISQVKTVEAGTPIGYGRTYTTRSETKVATVQIGYGDGYNRLLSNKGRMIVKGSNGYAYANVIGRVCMDQTMIDVTGIDGIVKGGEVIVMGEGGGLSVTADDIADICGTISYEVLLDYSRRVPRIYV
jgi:alanine racemase